MSKNAFRFLMVSIFLITCIFAVASFGQNPQTQTAPPYATNAKYANGVAPGYWVQQLYPTIQTGLVLNVSQGAANCGSGVITAYSGGTLTMTASTTNYIYLNTSASCIPAVKTTAFTANDIPIAVVVTGSGSITSINDVRTQFNAPASAVSGVSSFNTRTGAVVLATSDVNGLGTLSNPTTGNAATASALESSPTQCGTGEAANGIAANGNAQGCFTPAGGSGCPEAGVITKTSSYTAVNGDCGETIALNGAGVINLNVPATNPGVTWWIGVTNISAQQATVSPNGLSIDGSEGIWTLAPGMGVRINSDGSVYYTGRGGILTSSLSNKPVLLQTNINISPNPVSTINPVTAGSCILVETFHDDSSTNIVTDNQGNSYTEYNYQDVGAEADFRQFVATNVVGGPLTATAANPATIMVIYEYSNCGGVDVVNSNSASVSGDLSSYTLGTGNITTTNGLDLLHVTSATRAAASGIWTESNGYAQVFNSGFLYDALSLASWDNVPSNSGTYSDTLTFSGSLNIGAMFSSILAFLPSSDSTNFSEGDLVQAGLNGHLEPLKCVSPCAAGDVLTANGPGAGATYKSPTSGGGSSSGVVLINGTNPGFENQTGVIPVSCPDTSGSATAGACSTTIPTQLYFTPTTPNCIVYTTTTSNSGASFTIDVNDTSALNVAVPSTSGWTTSLTADIIPVNKPILICLDAANHWDMMQTGTAPAGAPAGSAGGDLSGSYPNPNVSKINSVSLAGLATGLLKNTTSTGVPSIAAAGTDYVMPAGNVATATNLASYPTVCSGDQFSQGLSSGSNNCATPSGGSGCMSAIKTTLGSAATSITISSIPATCQDLIVSFEGSVASSTQSLEIQINGDTTTSDYGMAGISYIGSSSGALFGAGSFLNVDNQCSSAFSACGFTVIAPGYAGTTFDKNFTWESFGSQGSSSSPQYNGASGYWNSTAAITSVELINSGGVNFPIGSTLYVTGR